MTERVEEFDAAGRLVRARQIDTPLEPPDPIQQQLDDLADVALGRPASRALRQRMRDRLSPDDVASAVDRGVLPEADRPPRRSRRRSP